MLRKRKMKTRRIRENDTLDETSKSNQGQRREVVHISSWFDAYGNHQTGPDGPYERYYENGQLKVKCTYGRRYNGYGYVKVLVGPYEEYTKSGRLKKKGEYIDGQFITGKKLKELIKQRGFKEKVEQLVSKKKSDKPRQGLVALLDSLNEHPATPERKAAKEAAVKTYRKAHPKSSEREQFS